MTVNGISLCFVSCHLTPHETERHVLLRNGDIFEILRAMSSEGGRGKGLDITQIFDHVFVFGDLNYRISIGRNKAGSFDESTLKRQEEEIVRNGRFADTDALANVNSDDRAELREAVLAAIARHDFASLYRFVH
jgi:hypothetical protein